MKVLHVLTTMDPKAGGVSQAVRNMILGLSRLKVDNEVATLDNPQVEFSMKDDFNIYKCGPGKTPWQYGPNLLYWLKQNIGIYDVVIIHGLWQYPTYATFKAWKTLKDRKTRLFVMPHGMLDPYFQLAKERRLKALRNRAIWKLIEAKVINNSDGLLFTCEMEMELAKGTFAPYKPKNEKVVGLGVEAPPEYNDNMKLAFEQKLGQDIPASYWLYISRIDPKKGVDNLINAYLTLKQRFNNIPPLVIAGPGLEKPYGQMIKLLASVDSEIYFPGMLVGNEKWGAFYNCEVFILPSHQENFGIAVVEAMSCSKPVLISNQVNIWKEIINSNAGIANLDTLDGTLKTLNEWSGLTEDKKLKMHENAFFAFKNYFSTSQVSKRTFEVISTVGKNI